MTATWRMLSPRRANLAPCQSCHARAARTHAPMREMTDSLCQCPATTLRARRIRVWRNPASRSPWAAWLRFIKSMSISPQGRSRLNWVCRCRNGFRSAERPPIHIFAGENVCIHRINPAHSGLALASRIVARMASGVVRTGLKTTDSGSFSPRPPAIACELAATCLRVSGP